MNNGAPEIMPHDLQAEMAALGSAMLNATAMQFVLDGLSVDDFYKVAHQDIFRAIVSLAESKGTVEIILLRDELQKAGKLDKVGGAAYLQELMEAPTTSTNAEYYIAIVRNHARKRNILGVLDDMRRACGNGEDADDIIKRVTDMLDGQTGTTEDVVPLISKHVDAANERMEKQFRGEETALPLGIPRFDQRYGGLEPGEFMVVCAPTSVGKTALALNVLLDVAVQRRLPALFFSAEVIGPSLVLDLNRIVSATDWWQVRRGTLNADQAPKWQAGCRMLCGAPFYVDDTPGISIEELVRKATATCRKADVRLVVVDYIQLLRTSERSNSETLRLKHISNELKRLAGVTKVPVIVLSQYTNVDGERRTRYAPEITHDADVVLFLERGDKSHDANPENEADVCARTFTITKSRHQGVSWWHMIFEKPVLTFWTPERSKDDHGKTYANLTAQLAALKAKAGTAGGRKRTDRVAHEGDRPRHRDQAPGPDDQAPEPELCGRGQHDPGLAKEAGPREREPVPAD